MRWIWVRCPSTCMYRPVNIVAREGLHCVCMTCVRAQSESSSVFNEVCVISTKWDDYSLIDTTYVTLFERHRIFRERIDVRRQIGGQFLQKRSVRSHGLCSYRIWKIEHKIWSSLLIIIKIWSSLLIIIKSQHHQNRNQEQVEKDTHPLLYGTLDCVNDLWWMCGAY